MATPNPTENTFSDSSATVSKKTYTIAGISTTVYGLEELPAGNHNVACLWLLHPRLQKHQSMEKLADATIIDWNGRLQQKKDNGHGLGLIAVSFDQRNHGSRQIDPIANEAWKSGNERHAQDMFSIYHGTAMDTSQLMTYLSSYIFPNTEHSITKHLVLGISLGGHSVWHCILHEPRITTAVVVIGCPDYASLMADRARLSKLQTWTSSTPPGSKFLGSKDFPVGLIQAVEKYDPAGLFLGDVLKRTADTYTHVPSEAEKKRLVPLMESTLQGKRILNLSGGADKLVPYARGEGFLNWLKKAIAPDGWFKDGNVVLEDLIFDGVGHAMTPEMVKEAIRFIAQSLDESSNTGDRTSKI